MKETMLPPSTEALTALLEKLTPGSKVSALQPLLGSFSNSTFLVDIDSAFGVRSRIVVRRYAVFGDYDRGEKARREYRTLELLKAHAVPAPKPLFLDVEGSTLGRPGIITSFMNGKQVAAPKDPSAWTSELAAVLSRIHSISCEKNEADFLLDANSEATWFLRSDGVPDYMQAHPDGPAVWNALRNLAQGLRRVEPRLVHIDYQPGNILWEGEHISAVLDWEEAALGDAGIDVAYLCTQLATQFSQELAVEFLRNYETAIGKRVENLEFWELAAAVRMMPDPAAFVPEWQLLGNENCSAESVRQGLTQFIASAMHGTGLLP